MAVSLIFVLLLISSWPPTTAYSTITHLPGFGGPLPIELETGYVRVDEENDAQLFYYFIKSETNPREDPLLLWIPGGPGCSAISGLAFEIGPLRFDVPGYNGGLPSLFYDPRSWTKICSIIFIDSPVGTGFSYSRGLHGYETTDLKTSREVYTFIRKWFSDHTEFLSHPLYVGGESYSGIIVPIVAQVISNGIEAGDMPLINLKGYMVGNPWTDIKRDLGSRVPYAHGMGLISDELYESTKKSCGGEYASPSNAQCAKHIESVNECLTGVNYAHILEPSCFYLTPKPNHVVASRKSLIEHAGELYLPKSILPLECKGSAYLLSYIWANNNTVREALNIRKGTISEWRRCNYDLPYTSDVLNSLKYHLNLTSRGYRALVYSGDHDMFVPFVGTLAWVRSLNFSIVDDWRSWSVGGQVAGFTRTYSNNLTFATVKGGGHTAPEYRPKECFAMFQRWISGNSL